MRTYLFVILFILSATVSFSQTVYKQEEGKLFPLRSYVTIDGEKIDSIYLQGKVVIYNFYFDGCEACRAEMNGLNMLYDKYTDDNTVFIAITPDNTDKATQTREKYGLKFKIVSLPGSGINELKGRTNYPTNIIVGKNGKIAFKESGTVIPEYWTNKHVMETFGPVIENLKTK